MAISKIPSAGFQDNVKFRNIIINGGMDIAQRSTSVSGITDGNTYHTVDRMKTQITTAGTWTQSQSTDVPTGQGFAKSLKMDCTTADASLGADDLVVVRQDIEGQNLQYLKYGTSNAESITLSWWVKSSKTGTYIIWLYHDGTSNRQISKSYTINSADTWEKKTITFAGDTAQAFANDNDSRLRMYFFLAAGSNSQSGTLATSWEDYVKANRAVGQVNLADSTANEWYITGVQLEAGQISSEFEFLPVDVNLARCQRYYFLKASHSRSSAAENIGVGFYYNSTDMRAIVPFPTEMRARPSIDVVSASNAYQLRRNNGFDNVDDFVLDGNVSLTGTAIQNNTDASGTAGQAGHLFTNSSSGFLAFDAEL